MTSPLADDLAALPELLQATRDYAVSVLAGLDERPVAPTPARVPAAPLPVAGVGTAGALAAFERRWAPGFSGSAGPRYLGFVTGGTTPAALAGDWLTSAFDQNVSNRSGSSAAALEDETVAWLGEMFGLTGHHGAFVSGATMSNLVGFAIGREWIGARRGVSVARQGLAALGEVTVLSGAAHSSVHKALSILGLGRDALRPVATLPDREAVDVAALESALAALDGPAIVVANAGTVNTVDFDDLRAILALRDRYPFWLHVDAAFGGFAALSPEHAHLVAGLAGADSVCIDLHKWLNVPYDAAVQFTRHRDLQVAVFQNSAAYLPAITGDPDFFHLTPENSRRLRALAAWFTLTAYGTDGHRAIVTGAIAAAHRLGERLTALPGVRLLAPVRLNVVCFHVPGDPAAVVRAIADSGEAFLTPTVYQGVPALRAAFSNWRTAPADADRVHDLLRDILTPRP
ncbi:pyridoxal phosphate-dependent decarboxylase family protein [Actinoplanes xinjiangensis]|uniref:Glutamate/tyrosine decarboxylase-like PLP-dependent enzyme n=1 Tax=Actinoplanes xinjiangensis TaxID=512350 RepID=A0A316FUZ2_9ACTN|nr:pyridoxal-dependent decarboxylase [Actinoplanes xinjiangensis]PWK52604.1 glutamate/tyrosine decarboxylase-like PLP-dependent enzyme [Actinoplanes xinjiangensis]GIF36699.1 aspartate aminotransferase family protein [Actinoplanes xinjiangensis]